MSEATDSTDTTTTTPAANGKPEKGPSLLDVLHKAWEAAGKKDPSEKQSKAMIADFEKKQAAVDAAKAVLDKAQAEVDAAAKAIVAAHGREFELVLNGEKYAPASYEQKVYFRRVNSSVKKTLGG